MDIYLLYAVDENGNKKRLITSGSFQMLDAIASSDNIVWIDNCCCSFQIVREK